MRYKWCLGWILLTLVLSVAGCGTNVVSSSPTAPFAVTPPYLAGHLTRAAATRVFTTVLPRATMETPSVSPRSTVVQETPLPVTEMYGYQNKVGGYAFNYPKTWHGIETQSNVIFFLPSGGTVSVHTEPALAGQTLEEFAAEVRQFPPQDVLEIQEVTFGGVRALCQKVAHPGESRLLAFTCLVIHRDQRYSISLAGLDSLTDDQVTRNLNDMEHVLNSFLWEN